MRKRQVFYLIFIFIFIGACNFPIKILPRLFHSYPTLDPAIFQPHSTSTVAPGTPSAPTPLPVNTDLSISYLAQSGDILKVVANHFGVAPDQITSPVGIPTTGLIPPGQQLIIPKTAANAFEYPLILPDSAVINSPCASDFDLFGYISTANGYLNSFMQTVGEERVTGAQVIQRVAENTSVNPRLLLAFVEYRSHWVNSYIATPYTTYPLGFNTEHFEGLYLELALAARMVNTGYYAWRQGLMTEITFIDGNSAPIAPNLNAGSVGIQYLFAQLYPLSEWEDKVYGPDGFILQYQNMFGDAWACAQQVEPLLREDLQPPVLELPFAPGEPWALTGGLHPDWNSGTPFGALDFAPITREAPCVVSRAWVRAAAPGLVTRSKNNQVIIALEDAEGRFTGWEIMYMHIADRDHVAEGTRLKQDDPIGHPSCEGGASTGTHVHITRKFKGEWISTGEPFPFILSGWTALPGELIYKSSLVKGDRLVTADPGGGTSSVIVR